MASRWSSARWALAQRLERLASSSPLSDLMPYRETLHAVCVLGEAPPNVADLAAQLAYAIADRERVQARAAAVMGAAL